MWLKVYCWNLFHVFNSWCCCCCWFASIRFGSLYYIIILKHTYTFTKYKIHVHAFALRRVSISILIVANGNIRVDLNSIAWYSVVWYGVILWWLEKQSEYTKQRWQRHVHEFPIENPYKKGAVKTRNALWIHTQRLRVREFHAETIERTNNDFVWFNRILWHFVPYNWIVVSKRCISCGHFHFVKLCDFWPLKLQL